MKTANWLAIIPSFQFFSFYNQWYHHNSQCPTQYAELQPMIRFGRFFIKRQADMPGESYIQSLQLLQCFEEVDRQHMRYPDIPDIIRESQAG